jgi:hypothetical protein
MKIFEAWEDEDGVTFSTQKNIGDHKEKGLLAHDARLLHQIEAENYDEAIILHHQKMGWEPYRPMGENDKLSR